MTAWGGSAGPFFSADLFYDIEGRNAHHCTRSLLWHCLGWRDCVCGHWEMGMERHRERQMKRNREAERERKRDPVTAIVGDWDMDQPTHGWTLFSHWHGLSALAFHARPWYWWMEGCFLPQSGLVRMPFMLSSVFSLVRNKYLMSFSFKHRLLPLWRSYLETWPNVLFVCFKLFGTKDSCVCLSVWFQLFFFPLLKFTFFFIYTSSTWMQEYIPIIKKSRTEITGKISWLSAPSFVPSPEVSRVINLQGSFQTF